MSTLGAFYRQLDISWYELVVFILTMILGGIYGYKAGKNLTLIHDIYPLRTLNLMLDKYMNNNGVEIREVDWEDREKAKYYNLEKDEFITY